MAYTVTVPLVGGGTRKRVIVDDNNNVDVDEIRVETINVVSKFQGDTAGFVTAHSRPASPGSPAGGIFEKQIEKFPFANESISTDVGDFHTAVVGHSGNSSNTHGYMSGGGPPAVNNIQKFSMSSTGNATDVGDLTESRETTGISNVSAAGYNAGGITSPYTYMPPLNTIDKFPFSSDTNATDVGDLTLSRQGPSTGISSPTNGYMASGGRVPNPSPPPSTIPSTNVIDKFPFATDEDATDVGDLTESLASNHQLSSLTNGYVIGGTYYPSTPPSFNSYFKIEKFPFATDENSQVVTDLTPNTHVSYGASVSSFEGGYAVAHNQNYKFLFASEANLAVVSTYVDVNGYDKEGDLAGHQI